MRVVIALPWANPAYSSSAMAGNNLAILIAKILEIILPLKLPRLIRRKSPIFYACLTLGMKTGVVELISFRI